jgi:hypothetical protein
MSNLYPEYKEFILAGATDVSLNVGTAPNQPFCSLNTAAFNVAHSFYSSLVGTNVGAEQPLLTPSVVDGVFSSIGVLTFPAVTGASISALVLYRHNAGANTTWKVFAHLDSVSISGLPVVPNGGNITVTWNVSGIFLL